MIKQILVVSALLFVLASCGCVHRHGPGIKINFVKNNTISAIPVKAVSLNLKDCGLRPATSTKEQLEDIKMK